MILLRSARPIRLRPARRQGFADGRPDTRPALVCVEAHPDVRQEILDYFTRHGYTVVGKYLRMDPKNLYFSPLD